MRRLALPLGLLLAAIGPAAAHADSLVYTKAGNVWISHSDGSAARQVTTAPNNWAWPSEADDGTIAVAGGQQRVNPGGTDSDGSSEIYRFDQFGHQIGGAVNTPGSLSSPQCPTFPPTNVRIAPNGQRFAYSDFFCDSITMFMEDFASGHFDAFATDYSDPLWLDDGHLLITHIGPTIGNAAFAVYDVAAGTGHGPTDDPYMTGREATASRDGSRVAVLENDAADRGGTAQNADIVLYATTGGDVTQPVQKCTLTLNAANISNFSNASPTFSPDGSRLAWGENDGIHVANTSNLDNCGTVAPGLLVPGGAFPFFGKADEAAAPPAPVPGPAPHSHAFALRSSTKTGKLTSRGALTFVVTSAESASGTATGTIAMPKHAKAVRFRTRRVNLSAGKRTKITLTLSKKDARTVRKALRHRKLSARITVTASSPSGGRASRRLSIKLKP